MKPKESRYVPGISTTQQNASNYLGSESSSKYGKKVLLRVDFNVSINNGGIIGEDYRIRRTIPTIEYLTKRGA